MKLKIEFTPNTELVPFTYMSNLNGYLHKILGEKNKYHNDISLYSTSFLHGGEYNKKKKFLDFPNCAQWYVSSPDNQFIINFINNIYHNTSFSFGMELKSVEIIKKDFLKKDNCYIFYTKSPILLKQKEINTQKTIYYTFEDDPKITSELMKKILLKKAKIFGLNIVSDDFDISFIRMYKNKKIKWIKIKKINNKTNVCPIFVKTTKPEIANFISEVGVGHSTGCGFGFLL